MIIRFPSNWFRALEFKVKVKSEPKKLPNGDYTIDVEPIGMTAKDVVKQLMLIK